MLSQSFALSTYCAGLRCPPRAEWDKPAPRGGGGSGLFTFESVAVLVITMTCHDDLEDGSALFVHGPQSRRPVRWEFAFGVRVN